MFNNTERLVYALIDDCPIMNNLSRFSDNVSETSPLANFTDISMDVSVVPRALKELLVHRKFNKSYNIAQQFFLKHLLAHITGYADDIVFDMFDIPMPEDLNTELEELRTWIHGLHYH